MHSLGEGSGTVNRVVLSSAMSGNVNAADMADVTKEKTLRQANENYTWKSIMHTGHVRAYTSMLAQNAHPRPRTQEGKTKAINAHSTVTIILGVTMHIQRHYH